jgi:Ser/Thr protein kinase RdoA (MazF antagonist)
VGDVVVLQNFGAPELRADGRSVSLTGVAAPGQPPIRVRWAGTQTPLRQFASGAYGRIVGTRETLLQEAVRDMDLHGLPDPIKKLPVLLNESVPGTQATIHGDLNLENALVGPGGFVWLIDFAQTRDGHTLYDFAHLEAEIIAHVIAPQLGSEPQLGSGPQLGSATAGFVAALRRGEYPLLNQMRQVAAKCLFNHTVAREYDLALYVTCLGATKYANLTRTQQHLLYLTAAHLAQSL